MGIRIATREADLPVWDAIERAVFGGEPLTTRPAPPTLPGSGNMCVFEADTLPSARSCGIASALTRRKFGLAPYASTALRPSEDNGVDVPTAWI